ncbi:peptidoglycan-binding domain-containing protein [Anaerosacchariphilus polymeriproducens]|uniref:Peptidoglycan-binding protein n=1 Tax=Anaerosacchariphilus polymeriproducens TaxID=1812858 RepID=A0A371AQU4_9FIRM|nr:peptidoglycan-binding protein [Anaerosacchariphilus polymeriproducens]RDU21955.1 peptidoglycan-binding protein [Anaerosacchariphilus polymeriproducens]
MGEYKKNKTDVKGSRNIVYPAQLDTQYFGNLRVHCTSENFMPIEGATVQVSSTATPGTVLGEFQTNNLGFTDEIILPAPAMEYSYEPGSTAQPYSDYTLTINAENFVPVTVSNIEVLPEVTAVQDASLRVQSELSEPELYVIPPHTLYGDYPPKIAEAEIKPTTETGEIVLQQVVIPEFVVVHDGPPTDTAAKNYYIRFRDYIKNVASSEIYATWPDPTIYANVLAILSFTLNRVYTEWYRNKGYNFTITSSTAFDHKWINGRNIFDNIGLIVDEIFVNYLSRPNVKQPILTQYCDGYKVECPNWMTQWGSKDLGEQGLSAIEILRHFYGDTMFINSATQVAGVPVSWPGSNLTLGSSGPNVRMIQEQLNKIAEAYTAIPKVAVNSQFDQQTQEAVKKFQEVFGMPASGIVDLPTWYKISAIYVAVSRIAEIG